MRHMGEAQRMGCCRLSAPDLMAYDAHAREERESDVQMDAHMQRFFISIRNIGNRSTLS